MHMALGTCALLAVLLSLAAAVTEQVVSAAINALMEDAYQVCVDIFDNVGAIDAYHDLVALAICEIQVGRTDAGLIHFGAALDKKADFSIVLRKFPQLRHPSAYLRELGNHLYSNGAYGSALEALFLALKMSLQLRPSSRHWRPARPADRPSVVIFASSSQYDIQWGPNSLESGGVGGSEEAVILLSRELARGGAWVEVYGPVPDPDIGIDAHGVLWLPWQLYDQDSPCTAFVSWRMLEAVFLPTAADHVYLWLHDMYLQRELFTPSFIAHLRAGQQNATSRRPLRGGGVLVLNEFHRKSLPKHVQDIAVVTGNGLDGPSLPEGLGGAETDWNGDTIRRCGTCFIYASSPMRGLDVVLEAWPRIRAAVPNATLEIYYGFPAYMDQYLAANPQLRAAKERIEQATQQEGVSYIGSVGRDELARANARAGFYLYPTSYPEIAPISLMRAQALGAIPITSRHLDCGLREVAKWDLGPTSPLGWQDPRTGFSMDGYARISQNETLKAEWADAVVSAALKAPEELERYRAEMMRWARSAFSWQQVARQWLALFKPAPDTARRHQHAGTPPGASLYVPWIVYGGNAAVNHALPIMALLLLGSELGIRIEVDAIQGESLVPRARNLAAARFLGTRFSHMLFVDADIVFDPKDVVAMVRADRDVIAGAYRMKSDEVLWAFNGAYRPTDVEGIYSADWLSTGFMLIHRRALEKIARLFPERAYRNNVPSYKVSDAYDYFPVGVDDTGIYQSEDYGFCALCRKSGIELFIYGNATLTHMGWKGFRGNLHQFSTGATAEG